MNAEASADRMGRALTALAFGRWVTGSEDVDSEPVALAAAVAEAEVEFLDRGFEQLERVLRAINADGEFEPAGDVGVARDLLLLGWWGEAPAEDWEPCDRCGEVVPADGVGGVLLSRPGGWLEWSCWACTSADEVLRRALDWGALDEREALRLARRLCQVRDLDVGEG
jgi:hypothetical protein